MATLQEIQQFISTDPEARRLFARVHDPKTYAENLYRDGDTAKAFDAYLKGRGMELPKGYKIMETGQIVEDHDTRDLLLKTVGLGAAAYGASYAPGMGENPAGGQGGFGGDWGFGNNGPTTTPGFEGPVNQTSGINWGDVLKKIAGVGIPSAALLAGRKLAGDGTNGLEQQAIPPELSALLAQAMRRTADQDPLAQAVNRQAFEGLPTYVKKGGG